MKWINSEDFLRISSRVDAGEQHKDAENSLQADNNYAPSRGARTEALVVRWGQEEGQVRATVSPGAAGPLEGWHPPELG